MSKAKSINLRDKRPLYLQAIGALTEMIEAGEYSVGSQLPSEAELGEMLGISRSTLREALGYLETFGMVSRQPGRGTFVTASHSPGFIGGIERLETFRELAERANKTPKVIERNVDSVLTTEKLQEVLNITDDTKLVKVESIEAVDGVRCMYLEDYIIVKGPFRDTLLTYEGSTLTYLIEKHEPPLSFARSKIFAINASAEIAKKLMIDEGQPVLYLEQKYHDINGGVIGLAYTYLVTDHFYFLVTRRVPPK
jgi:GntR family transcriptional regulator